MYILHPPTPLVTFSIVWQLAYSHLHILKSAVQRNCFRTHAHPDELVSDVIQLDVHVVLRVVNILSQLHGDRRAGDVSS
jgi:hypothetical protein